MDEKLEMADREEAPSISKMHQRFQVEEGTGVKNKKCALRRYFTGGTQDEHACLRDLREQGLL